MNLEKQIEAVRQLLTDCEELEAVRMRLWLGSGYTSDLDALEERQDYTERVSKQLQRLERALMSRDWKQNEGAMAMAIRAGQCGVMGTTADTTTRAGWMPAPQVDRDQLQKEQARIDACGIASGALAQWCADGQITEEEYRKR